MSERSARAISRTVRDILLKNTPPRIVEEYLRLAERAQVEDFGLLEDDICVLDTETTGLSFTECQLTEIACARMSGRKITGRFHTLVNPGQPIPKNIVELTGIRDIDVVDAPSPKEAVAKLAEFVAGAPVVAHNAVFDRTFIERVPGGHKVSDNWIDSLALSRIALPRLSTHKLQDMAEAFGCANVTHRAMDDVEALCGMWRVFLCGLTNLPDGLMSHLAEMHPKVEWAYRPIFSQLALQSPDTTFSLVGARETLLSENEVAVRNDVDELSDRPAVPPKGDIIAAFEPGGAVSKMYDNFESRPQQTEMALAVRDALATSSICSIEAGTGVGKSVAYLLPLALYAKKNNITCGVATKTNALTDQLIAHELPELDKVLPGGVSFSCLKGFDHYPCLRRLYSISHAYNLPKYSASNKNKNTRSEATIAADMLTAIAVSYAYVSQSIEGDIDSLGIRWGSVPRGMLTISSSECQRSRCPYYPKLCMLHGARRRAGSCDIVVTNHALLLRDIAADNNILPPVRNWVVDEAHSFEAEARKQWALEVSASDTRLFFEKLGSPKSGVLGSIAIKAAKKESSTLIEGLVAKAASESMRTQVASADFFDRVRDLGSLARSYGGYDSAILWISDNTRETKEWADLSLAGDEFAEHLGALYKALDEASRACSGVVENAAADLSDMARRAKEIKVACETILSGQDPSYVFSAELKRMNHYVTDEKLVAEKLDIGFELAGSWYPNMHSITFSSATISVGGTFDHFNKALGINLLDPALHSEVALESCYNFDENMTAIVLNDMPDPYDLNYLKALEDALFDIHVAMGGSVLTLFTNRREMTTVFNALRPRLEREGLEVVMQDKTNPAKNLRKRFVEEEKLSLMALKSFWEGFDAAGDTLRCVVIPKLPFTSPNDPISLERNKRDRQAWRNWSLPDAVLSLKQASGRLIRTSTDTGVLILADARLVTKGYGKVFLRSLPTSNISLLGRDNVEQYLRTWRKNRKA